MTRTINIKNYLTKLFVVEDESLLKTKQHKLPKIEVPPALGKLLYSFAKIQKAERILELGTLAGYSTLWLARALPIFGKIISLEINPLHATVARQNFKKSPYENIIEVREGNAEDLLLNMINQNEKSFDLIFIDADKKNYSRYLDLVLKLSRSGTLILSDNLIPRSENFEVSEGGIFQFNQKIASHTALESIFITTIVGDKGRIDALGVSIVK